MKPYEIEIYDRNFNFRANALLDPNEFQYEYDMTTTVKNTVTITNTDITIRDNASSGSAGDRKVATSDYIRINIGGGVYVTGVIVKLEKQNRDLAITYAPFIELFNHETLIVVEEVKTTNIEAYIKKLLEEAFVANTDSSQNIPGLTVTKSTSTTGLFDYNDSTEVYTIVNLLKDLIYPAFNKFLISIDFNWNIGNKTITATIAKHTSIAAQTIEAELPNVIDKNIIIRQTSDDTNKLTLIDTKNYSMTQYHYYLHPDYTFNSTNSNRIIPVVNQVHSFDSDDLTSEAYWLSTKQDLYVVEKFIDINRDLVDYEKSMLNSSINSLIVYVKASKSAQGWQDYYQSIIDGIIPIIISSRSPFADNSYTAVASYGDLEEEKAGHYFAQAIDVPTSPATYEVLTSKQNTSGLDASGVPSASYPEEDWETINVSGSAKYNTNTHANFIQTVQLRIYVWLYGYEGITTYNYSITVRTPLTSQVFSQAIEAYKQSDQFAAEFAAYKAQNLTRIVNGYAAKIFNVSKYKNLIELTIPRGDPLIKPYSLRSGQTVNVIYKGVTYPSVYTGFSFLKNGLMKLIFGTIRVELTKILNMKGV